MLLRFIKCTKKAFTKSHKTRPTGHSLKVVGGKIDKGKQFFVEQAITSELLKLLLQEVLKADSVCNFKRE